MPYHAAPRSSSLALALVFFLLLSACGSNDSPGSASDGGPDAAPPDCSELAPLTLGQCIDDDTGSPCLDFQAANRRWISLEDEPLVHSIVGLQGSPMFVLSVSGAGIAPGMDSTSPYVELNVTEGTGDSQEMIGGFAARPSVIDDPNLPGNKLAPQLYVVSFFAEEKVGSTVQIRAQARDLNEDQWCSEASFQIGTLIESPPLP